MTPRRIIIPFVAFIVLAAFAGSATAKSSGLVGEVGPGFSIEVTRNGNDVKTIKAGTYSIKIEDKSSNHNFHLIGPGVNKSTTVAFTGTRTWKVTLKKGTYTYQCDPHASLGMKGKFRVTG